MARFNYSHERKKKMIYGDPYEKVLDRENDPPFNWPKKDTTSGPRISKEKLRSKVSEEGKRKTGDLASKRNAQAMKRWENAVYRENYMAKESYDREDDEYKRFWDEQKRKKKW